MNKLNISNNNINYNRKVMFYELINFHTRIYCWGYIWNIINVFLTNK